MSRDIVERLRQSVTKGHEPTDDLAIEAADEIERLRDKLVANGDLMTIGKNEIERLRTEIERLEYCEGLQMLRRDLGT